MRSTLISLTIATGLLAAGTSLADHNSKNGEGTANMPNDIHNTRVETLENNDSEAFREFVQYGEGSKTVNRFDSEETQSNNAVEQKGNANTSRNQGEANAASQNRVETRTSKRNQSRTESRTNRESRAARASRPDRGATSARSRGGRRSGGKR